MKKIFFPIVMMASLLVAGCVKENLVEPDVPQSGVTVLTANVDAATRTVLQDDEKVLWTNGDKINVNGVESAALELEEAAASAQFTFEGLLESPYKAVFPSSIYKDATTVTLPAYQTYKEGSFSATASPMAAFSETSSLKFNHLCSVLKLTVNLPADSEHKVIEYVDFYGKNNEQVSGDFTIDFDALSLSGVSTADADRKIRYKVSKTLGEEPFVMYIVVPAQEYASGYTIKVLDDKGHFMEKSKASEQTLEAGKIYDMPEFDFVPTGTDLDVEIATAQDLIAFATDYNTGKYADEDLLTVALVQDITFDAETSAAYAATGGIGTIEGPDGDSNYFNGVFDGNGKAIKGYVANIPLFAYTGSNGYIRNLLIDETSAFTFDASKLDYMSAVVGYHRGEIKNVTVASDITVADAAVAADKYIGSICGRIVVGSVEGASYTGSISVPSGFSVTGKKAYVGGIAGRISNADGVIADTDFAGTMDFAGVVTCTENTPYLMLGGIVGDNAGTVINCEVSANKTFKAVSPVKDTRYYNVSIANRTRTAYSAAQGGVAGFNTGKIEKCVNNASFASFLIAAGANLDEYNANARYLHTGGVVGYNSEGEIVESTNAGVFQIRSSSRMMYTGGVVGTNTGVVRSCTNETTASFAIQTADSAPYGARQSFFGGVIGNNTSVEVSNVQNKAALTLGRIEDRASTYVYMGGVIGNTSKSVDGTSAKNISNSGKLTFTNSVNNQDGLYVAGVVGYSSADILNVENSGAISFNSTGLSQKLYTAGVVAYCKGNVEEASNSGNIALDCSLAVDGVYASGIVGYSESSVKKSVNTGAVIEKSIASTTNLYLSGIVGAVVSAQDVEISGCRNEGEVYFNAATKSVASSVEYTNNFIGGVLAHSVSNVAISSCENTGYVHGGDGQQQIRNKTLYVGGIVGYLMGKSSITTCTNSGNVLNNHSNNSSDKAGSLFSGGIVGFVEGSADNLITVNDCNITTEDDTILFGHRRGYVGGIAGYAEYAILANCANDRSFSGSSYFIGGIVGWLVNATVKDCDWTGSSITSSQINNGAGGGIVAKLDAAGVIDSCNSFATTFTNSNNKPSLFGLLAGTSVAGSTIKNCHYKAGLSLGICSDTNFTGENNTADL